MEKIKRMNCLPENQHSIKLRAAHITNTNKNSAQPFSENRSMIRDRLTLLKLSFFVGIAIIYVFKFI